MATQIGEALCHSFNTTPNRLEDRNMDPSKSEHHNMTLHHESSSLLQFYDFSILSKSSLHLLQTVCLFGKMVQLTGQLHKPLVQELCH